MKQTNVEQKDRNFLKDVFRYIAKEQINNNNELNDFILDWLEDQLEKSSEEKKFTLTVSELNAYMG